MKINLPEFRRHSIYIQILFHFKYIELNWEIKEKSTFGGPLDRSTIYENSKKTEILHIENGKEKTNINSRNRNNMAGQLIELNKLIQNRYV